MQMSLEMLIYMTEKDSLKRKKHKSSLCLPIYQTICSFYIWTCAALLMKCHTGKFLFLSHIFSMHWVLVWWQCHLSFLFVFPPFFCNRRYPLLQTFLFPNKERYGVEIWQKHKQLKKTKPNKYNEAKNGWKVIQGQKLPSNLIRVILESHSWLNIIQILQNKHLGQNNDNNSWAYELKKKSISRHETQA